MEYIESEKHDLFSKDYFSLEAARLNEVLKSSGITDTEQRRQICKTYLGQSGRFLDCGWFISQNLRISPQLCFAETSDSNHPVNKIHVVHPDYGQDCQADARCAVDWLFKEAGESAAGIESGDFVLEHLGKIAARRDALAPDELKHRQDLLLMAAFHHGAKPDQVINANCGRVVQQALLWDGLGTDETSKACEALEECDEKSEAVVCDWYYLLIQMSKTPSPDLLIEVQGNTGRDSTMPAAAAYTGCRLTTKGRELAESLLDQHPDYRA